MQPKLTVVIPAYNREKTIADALDSVLLQQYSPLEIIVVDDGSTDQTAAWAHFWYEHNYSRGVFEFRYLSQENKGANSARNLGVEESTGEVVAFLDSDDRWLPGKLTRQIQVLQTNPMIGGVYCGMRNVDLESGEKEPLIPREYPCGKILRELLIHDVTEATSSWIVRKECFKQSGGFDTQLPARQDWDMWIRLAEHYEIGCVPEVLVELGNHSGERVRSDHTREIRAHKIIFKKYAHLRRRFPIWVSFAARSAMYRRRGRVFYHRKVSVPKAIFYQLMAIMIWPFNFDSYAALGGIFLSKGLRAFLRSRWNRALGKTAFAIKTH